MRRTVHYESDEDRFRDAVAFCLVAPFVAVGVLVLIAGVEIYAWYKRRRKPKDDGQCKLWAELNGVEFDD